MTSNRVKESATVKLSVTDMLNYECMIWKIKKSLGHSPDENIKIRVMVIQSIKNDYSDIDFKDTPLFQLYEVVREIIDNQNEGITIKLCDGMD